MTNPAPQAVKAKNRKSKSSHSRLVNARIAEVQKCFHRNELHRDSAIWRSLGEHKALILRLAGVLDELGLVFRYFQRYLSCRPDLITADDCLILESALNSPLPIDEDQLKQMLGDDIRGVTEESSEACYIISKPSTNEPLRLEFHRHEFISSWETDRYCLAPLAPVIERIWPHLDAENVITDFQDDTTSELDFENRLDWLKLIPKTSNQLMNEGYMGTLQVHEKFSSDSCIALLNIPGGTVTQALFQMENEAPSHHSSATSFTGSRHVTVARALCQSWLSQMFLGDWIPISLRPSHIGLGQKSRNVHFHGGTVSCQSSDTKMRLLGYVMATAFGISDEVAESLSELMEPEDHCEGLGVLKRRIGQIVPFRDGGWAKNGKNELLADHLYIQWQIARDCGYQESEPFKDFHRSIFALAHIANRIAPNADLLKDTIYEFRMRKAVTDLVESGKLSSVIEQGEKAIELFFDLGHKFKRILERNSSKANNDHSKEKSQPNNGKSLLHFFGLYVALLALAIVASKASDNFEALISATFLIVAAGLLYSITRLK